VGTEPVDYCREIEAYLCRKNDGHLVRVVGPSFELVSGWDAEGIPLKVAFEGIDRYFERYYRKGARRRPVRIDFCDADVRDVFDEWRRALGLSRPSETERGPAEATRASGRNASLPEHLERASMRLTTARATGRVGADVDVLIDQLSHELDAARAAPSGVRGEARRAAIARLAALDNDLLRLARAAIGPDARAAIAREAEQELAGFRDRMPEPAYRRALDAASDRLVRGRLGLPVLIYE
jgi:hypothetical protein